MHKAPLQDPQISLMTITDSPKKDATPSFKVQKSRICISKDAYSGGSWPTAVRLDLNCLPHLSLGRLESPRLIKM